MSNRTESVVALLVLLVCAVGVGLLLGGSETGAIVCLAISATLVTGGVVAIIARGGKP